MKKGNFEQKKEVFKSLRFCMDIIDSETFDKVVFNGEKYDIKTQKGLMTSKNLNMMPRPIGGFMMSAPFASQLALCAEK